MTYKMIFIVAAAAAFAWGFSTLVEYRDHSVRPEGARIACSDWPGDGCSRPSPLRN